MFALPVLVPTELVPTWPPFVPVPPIVVVFSVPVAVPLTPLLTEPDDVPATPFTPVVVLPLPTEIVPAVGESPVLVIVADWPSELLPSWPVLPVPFAIDPELVVLKDAAPLLVPVVRLLALLLNDPRLAVEPTPRPVTLESRLNRALGLAFSRATSGTFALAAEPGVPVVPVFVFVES